MTMKIEGVNVAHQSDGNLRITVTGTEGASEVMRSWIADTADALAYASFVDDLKDSLNRRALGGNTFIPDAGEDFRADD